MRILLLLNLLLISRVSCLPSHLGLVVFNLHSRVKLLMFNAFQLLRLDDILQIALVTVTLQLGQQVKLVLFQLLNASVQTVDRIEHLVVLRLELDLLVFSFLY